MHAVSIVFVSIVYVWLADCARMIPVAVFIALSLAQAAQAPPEVTLVLTDHHFRLHADRRWADALARAE